MVFVANDKSPEVEEPTDGSLNLVAFPVATKRATILNRILSASSMRTDEFDSACGEIGSNPIGVSGLVVEQAFGLLLRDAILNERFDRVDLGATGRKREGRQRRPVAIDHQHDLGAFALLRLAYVGAPFFAGANVPSPIASSQSICLSLSSFFSRRDHAFSQTPDRLHASNRRQHVEGLGYRSGKSCHRAPVFSTHRMPSKQGLGATRGRPPSFDFGGSGNRSLIRTHCESSRNGFGAVLDPVVLGRRLGGQFDREMTMRVTPFTRLKCNILAN